MCDAYDCEQLSQTKSIDRRVTQFDDVICKKCRVNTSTVKVHAQGSHCETCFIAYCHHKFRSTIGRENLVKYGDRILAAFSGGPSSLAMLSLLHAAVNEKKKKKLSFSVHIIHIRSSGSCQSSVVDVIKSFEPTFPYTILDFEKCSTEFHPKTSTNDLSADIDRTHNQTMHLIRHYCKDNGFDWIMSGQSLFRSSVVSLTNVALGRGADIGPVSLFCDDRDHDARILHPLREFTSKEVSFYNNYLNLTPVQFSPEEQGTYPRSSIQRLTEKFLLDLQPDFPSAVPNVRNSSEKVLSRNSAARRCPMCLATIRSDTCQPSAYSASQFSDICSGISREFTEEQSTVVFCTHCKYSLDSG